MRVFLLAIATVTTRAGRRSRSALIQVAAPNVLVRARRITEVVLDLSVADKAELARDILRREYRR